MKRWEPSKLFIILSTATVLRVPGLYQTLWYDEAYTAYLARLPILQMVQSTMSDVHPPTWYLIEQAAVRLFGMSEAALRLPALVLGVLAVYLTYRLAVRLGLPERHALLAAGLLAVNPFAVYYSNEARMYALLLCAVLLAYLGALERRLWLLGMGTGLALLTHNMAILYLPIVAGLVLVRWGPRFSIKQLLSPYGAMGLGSLPFAAWLPVVIHQATTGQFENRYWIDMMTGNVFSKLLADWCLLWFPPFRPIWLGRVGGLVAMALIVFPMIEVVRRRRMGWAAVMAFAPGLISLVISLAWQPIILARTLIASVPGWCILIAWWVTLPRRWDFGKVVLMGTAAALVVACLLSFIAGYDRLSEVGKLIDWLKVNNHGDPVCVVESGSVQAVFAFYYPAVVQITEHEDSCVYVVDERYITNGFESTPAMERALALPGAREVIRTRDNPAIMASIWKVR